MAVKAWLRYTIDGETKRLKLRYKLQRPDRLRYEEALAVLGKIKGAVGLPVYEGELTSMGL